MPMDTHATCTYVPNQGVSRLHIPPACTQTHVCPPLRLGIQTHTPTDALGHEQVSYYETCKNSHVHDCLQADVHPPTCKAHESMHKPTQVLSHMHSNTLTQESVHTQMHTPGYTDGGVHPCIGTDIQTHRYTRNILKGAFIHGCTYVCLCRHVSSTCEARHVAALTCAHRHRGTQAQAPWRSEVSTSCTVGVMDGPTF